MFESLPESEVCASSSGADFQGGHILLGVDDDGSITGVQRDDLEPWVMDTVFGRTVHPMILPFYEEVRVDDRLRVVVITISQGTTKPYVVRHHGREDIYIRDGPPTCTIAGLVLCKAARRRDSARQTHEIRG